MELCFCLLLEATWAALFVKMTIPKTYQQPQALSNAQLNGWLKSKKVRTLVEPHAGFGSWDESRDE